MAKALKTNLVNGRNEASVSTAGELSVIVTDMPAIAVDGVISLTNTT